MESTLVLFWSKMPMANMGVRMLSMLLSTVALVTW